MKKSFCSGIVILCASLILPSITYGYTIENLGTLGGMTTAQDINNNNEVVGISIDGGGVWRAVKWTDSSGLSTIVSDANARAYGINDSGQVAMKIGNNAYRWSSGSGTELLSGPLSIALHGITESGGIYGYHTDNKAAYWTTPTSYTTYAYPAGRNTDIMSAYSDGGYKVGYSYLYSSGIYDEQAMCWLSSSTYVELGDLSAGQASQALSINASEQIVGWAKDSSGVKHAVLWETFDQDVPVDLGTGVAKQISSDGSKIVGIHDDKAVVWVYETDSWIMYYLNDFLEPASGWDLKLATGINDNNMIIGDGLLDGQYRAFIFDFNPAVPEPLSIITVLIGIAALKLRRKK
jgi:hypothetical protein